MTTTKTLEPPIQANCARCPYFQDFNEPNGRGLCQLFDKVARRHHFRTGDCDQEIKMVEVAQPPAPQPAPQRQSTGFSGDSVGCQLRTLEVEAIQPVATPDTAPEPTPDVECESQFDLGSRHGQHDALRGWHASYKMPATDYARGYLAGYNALLNPISPQVEVSNPVVWTVSFDKKWHWYWVWVGKHCIGQASTYQDAERMATERIATDEVIFAQNEAVMKAYAAEKMGTPNSSVRKKSEVAQKYSEEFEQMSTCGKLEIIQEILGHRQQALDEAAKMPGKVYLRAPAYSSLDEEGMDAFFRKVNSSERQCGSLSNQQKSLVGSALINDEPVPNLPELAHLSARAKNNIALALINQAATNMRQKEQVGVEHSGQVKLYGIQSSQALKDDKLRDVLLQKGFADDARDALKGMQFVSAYLPRTND